MQYFNCKQIPVFLREAPDQLQHDAVRHQVQWTLAFMVGVVYICTLLSQETGDSSPDVQLGVPQQPRAAQLSHKQTRRKKFSPSLVLEIGHPDINHLLTSHG